MRPPAFLPPQRAPRNQLRHLVNVAPLNRCERRHPQRLPLGRAQSLDSPLQTRAVAHDSAVFPRSSRISRSPIFGASISGRFTAPSACSAPRALIVLPARSPNTTASSSELLARRFAPCTPVHATSPAA